MTVRELIEKLQEFDGDLLVVGSGYESGYDPISVVQTLTAHHWESHPYYEGEYQHHEYYGKEVTVLALT